jgi:CBS-domain-containing membrane protein
MMYRFLQYHAAEYMSRDVITATRDMSLSQLANLFAKHDFNAFPVMEEDRMVGLVTKFDFLKAFAFTTRQMVPHYETFMEMKVGEVMTEAIVDVQPEAPLTRVLQFMIDLRTRSLPVRERGGRLVGMISREDIMRALQEAVAQGRA